MTTELQKAAAHTILPVERLGDTLLVTPHGDLGGYSPLEFQAEFQRVKSVLKDASFKNLIIDLGGSRYFGSEMIGALVALREQMIGRGRVALAEVSRDTLVGLQTVKADTLFEIFAMRSAAIHQISRLTIADRLARYRRPLISLACLLLVALLVWGCYATRINFRLFGSRTARTYDAILKEWNDLEHGEAHWTGEESRIYREQMMDEMDALTKSIQRQHLYRVDEDYWLLQAIAAFQNILHSDKSQQDEFFRAMRYARICIERRTGIVLRHVGPPVEDEGEEPPEPPTETVEDDEPDVAFEPEATAPAPDAAPPKSDLPEKTAPDRTAIEEPTTTESPDPLPEKAAP